VEAPPNRDELLALYRLALEEYRFQVRLNWDRSQYFLVLNVGIIAAATGLAKLGGPDALKYLSALLFLSGMVACAVGIHAIRRGHGYYRNTVYQVTALEMALSLRRPSEIAPGRTAPLGVATTDRLRTGYPLLSELPAEDEAVELSPRTVTGGLTCVLGVLGAIDAFGAVLTALF
jgi:hypothetical protein